MRFKERVQVHIVPLSLEHVVVGLAQWYGMVDLNVSTDCSTDIAMRICGYFYLD